MKPIHLQDLRLQKKEQKLFCPELFFHGYFHRVYEKDWPCPFYIVQNFRETPNAQELHS